MPPKKQMADEAQVEKEDGISTVRAVDRAIAILRSFTVETPSMSVIEIQQRVGLSRPTLYRLLQTLGASGMIEAEGDPQRFRLAAGVMQLAHTWLSGLSVVDAARPIIDRLREETGETAALFLMRGHERLCVLEQKSRHVLAISRGIGDTGPLVKGASGKAILAFMSDAQRSGALEQVTDPIQSDLARVLEQIHRDGFALSRGEVFAGAVALAAPIFDHAGDVVGSIGVFGPSARVTGLMIPDLAARVVAAAEHLSTQLGHRKVDQANLAKPPGNRRS